MGIETIEVEGPIFSKITYLPPPEDYSPSGEHVLRSRIKLLIKNCFVCRGFKIYEGDDGFWVSMPDRRDNQGNYHDRFIPVTEEGQQLLESIIIENFKETKIYDQSKLKKYFSCFFTLRDQLIKLLGGTPP